MSKYIKKGSYGCIIKPNINCDGSFGKQNEVSKFFFDKMDYLDEKKLQEKIDKIDKNKSFTIKKISNCKIQLTPEIKKKISNLNLCDLDTDEIYQITYEYGGIDIHRLFKLDVDKLNRIDFFDFLQRFSNVFDGLCKINNSGLIHFDIRTDNILYDLDKKKFVIIDFGLLKEKKNVFRYDKIQSFRKSPHPNYPNEISIISNLKDGIFYKDLNKYHLNSNYLIMLIDNKMMNIIHRYKLSKNPYFKKVLNEFITIFNYFDVDIFKNFNPDIYEKIFHKKSTIAKLCFDIAGKIDVYMLGIVLLEILLHIFMKSYNNPSIQKIPIKLFSLIKKMVLLNPCDRPTIQQATKEFKIIMMKQV